MLQIWKARWKDTEGPHELIFDSLNNLMIARIDFALKFNHAYPGPVPKQFELEEVHGEVRRTLLQWGVVQGARNG